MSEGVSKIELGKTYEVCAYWVEGRKNMDLTIEF